jgi:signal transduction histidine kinase
MWPPDRSGIIGPMTTRAGLRWSIGLPLAVFAVGAALQVAFLTVPGLDNEPRRLAAVLAVLGTPVALGTLLAIRTSGPVGPALAWVGAAPTAVFAVEFWGESSQTTRPWPLAEVLYPVQLGAWVWNLAGFAALCLVFPTGLLPGRRWRVIAGLAVLAAVVVNIVVPVIGSDDVAGGLPVAARAAILLTAFAGVLAALGATVVSLVLRYRRGGDVVRQQLRWLVLGAGTVPVLLAAGWALETAGSSPAVAYTGFLVAMLLAVPAAVAVAVLRYDLFDVDRLLGSSLAWLATTVGSAAIFAAVVVAGGRLGAGSRLGVTGAAFVTALALIPLHRFISTVVGRLVDRDRYVVMERIRRFVGDVRDGTVEPEQTERLLRDVLVDQGLRLLLHAPGDDGYVDLAGQPAQPAPDAAVVALRSGDTDVGVIVLGVTSARRLRRAREAALQARLPIEVSRLRLELRLALRDVEASRERLMRATADERRRLERDLHDGAQQQIVAVGMRLRSLQRGFAGQSREFAELDTAVESLEATIAELRRLAHGVRPSQLDDGLPAALKALVAHSPVPVDLAVEDVTATPADLTATTLYFVVAEAYANALKHANAGHIAIAVRHHHDSLLVEVSDDGVGGADTDLPAVRDRVASIGGTVRVHSPHDGGTTITAEIPDAHRRRG